MSQALTDAVVAAAQHVPSELLDTGAAAVESVPEWSAGAGATLIAASPATHYREHARRVEQAWSESPALSGAVVAAAMRAAAATAGAVRAEHKVSLVWTGPTTEAIGLNVPNIRPG